MGIGKSFKKGIKKIGSGVAKGLRKVGSMAEDFYESDLGRAYIYASLAVAIAATGGLAAGLSPAVVAATTVSAAASGAYTGYQSANADQAQKEAKFAEAEARRESEVAARESEILRKQALLANEKSMTARKAAAGSVANKLKNTRGGVLGEEEEKLGG